MTEPLLKDWERATLIENVAVIYDQAYDELHLHPAPGQDFIIRPHDLEEPVRLLWERGTYALHHTIFLNRRGITGIGVWGQGTFQRKGTDEQVTLSIEGIYQLLLFARKHQQPMFPLPGEQTRSLERFDVEEELKRVLQLR